jgi:hypothetical protein
MTDIDLGKGCGIRLRDCQSCVLLDDMAGGFDSYLFRHFFIELRSSKARVVTKQLGSNTTLSAKNVLRVRIPPSPPFIICLFSF